MRDGQVSNQGMSGLGSPSTFMKLQTPDTTTDDWYEQEGGNLGVVDIFNEHTL